MGRHGQTALEFLVLLGFMLLVFTTFFAVMHERSSMIRERNRYTELIAIGEVIKEEAQIAQQVHDGYRRAFDLPTTIQGLPYTIELADSSEVTIKTAEKEYLLFLPVNITHLQGGVEKEDGQLKTGRNVIRKADGKVLLTPVTAFLSATPNPCVSGAMTSCTSTISWSGLGEEIAVQLWVQQDNGAETYTGQCGNTPGAYAATINDGTWYTFRLYAATGCTAAQRVGTTGQELTSIIVRSE